MHHKVLIREDKVLIREDLLLHLINVAIYPNFNILLFTNSAIRAPPRGGGEGTRVNFKQLGGFLFLNRLNSAIIRKGHTADVKSQG